MYICSECGRLYDEMEVETPYETDREMFSTIRWRHRPPVVTVETCECGGELEKAEYCQNCFEWTSPAFKYCDECLDKYRTLDTMLEIGEDNTEKISINGMLFSSFTVEEIEQILIDTLRSMDEDELKEKVNKYCEEDITYFKRFAEEKWKEEK